MKLSNRRMKKEMQGHRVLIRLSYLKVKKNTPLRYFGVKT